VCLCAHLLSSNIIPSSIHWSMKILHLISYTDLLSFLFPPNYRCDAEHFLDELGLDAIPKGDWFCNVCVEKKSVAPQSAKKLQKVSAKTAAAKSTSTPQKKTEKAAVEIDIGVSRKRGTEAVINSPAPEGRRSARLH
jgi:hypothetical protein